MPTPWSTDPKSNLIRIAVFYDGNYFQKVNYYYANQHERKARLSIEGLHAYIRDRVGKQEGVDASQARIVDAHYFRGRLRAFDARERNMLYSDRFFEDILMRENVVTHYLPIKTRDGKILEKGIDVWLALEAYELSVYKKFDVLVLIACDGDYVPLVRKLNTIGTRVMLLSWDFKYIDKLNLERETRTSQDLLDEATYPVAMHELIDNRITRNDPIVNQLFVSQEVMNNYRRETEGYNHQPAAAASANVIAGARDQGTIIKLGNGFGFIKYPPNNLYFGANDVVDYTFEELQVGDVVEFSFGKNIRDEDVAKLVRPVFEEEDEDQNETAALENS